MQLETILNIKFNSKQKSAIKSLRWYFKESGKNTNGELKYNKNGLPEYENRGTGRTTLGLALVIEMALENIGNPIKIFDHYAITGNDRFTVRKRIVQRLRKMIDDSKLKNLFEIDENNSTITAFDKEV